MFGTYYTLIPKTHKHIIMHYSVVVSYVYFNVYVYVPLSSPNYKYMKLKLLLLLLWFLFLCRLRYRGDSSREICLCYILSICACVGEFATNSHQQRTYWNNGFKNENLASGITAVLLALIKMHGFLFGRCVKHFN